MYACLALYLIIPSTLPFSETCKIMTEDKKCVSVTFVILFWVSEQILTHLLEVKWEEWSLGSFHSVHVKSQSGKIWTFLPV